MRRGKKCDKKKQRKQKKIHFIIFEFVIELRMS